MELRDALFSSSESPTKTSNYETSFTLISAHQFDWQRTEFSRGMETDNNKIYSYQEVSLHNRDKDCWIIINAKVYNVTSFLDDHPGGGDVLLESAGNDASEEFEAVGHGSAARLMLDEYYVGEIDQSTKPTSMATPAETVHTFIPSSKIVENVNNGGTSSSVSIVMKLLPFLMPLLILGFAAMVGFFSTSSSSA